MNKFDAEYKTSADILVQQITGEGFTVKEGRYILQCAMNILDQRVNETKLQFLGRS